MDLSNQQRGSVSNTPTTLRSHDGTRGTSLTSSLDNGEECEMDTNGRGRGTGSRRSQGRVTADEVAGRNMSNCCYIPPGDHERENYRVGTFGQYPKDSPVLPVMLARAGFYYTGFKDRTKCFSCGLAVESWCPGDDVFDARWHRQNCSMARGEDHRNIQSSFILPLHDYLGSLRNTAGLDHSDATGRLGGFDDEIVRNMRQVNIGSQELILATITNEEHRRFLLSLDLRQEKNRRKTYLKWPCYPAPDLPGELARNGFFYLGNLDRAQCFACSGVLRNWTSDSIVREHHKRHFPNCRFHRGNQHCGNVPMTDQQRRDADEADRLRAAELIPSSYGQREPSDEEKRILAQKYPCGNPVNPHMIAYTNRLATFANAWTRNDIQAKPEQIAEAGFFYLGEADKVKCWYCNGGLQHWERDDEPWVEHGKWFPNCEFVKRHKGEHFARYLEETHPNLNRPAPMSNPPYDIAPTLSSHNGNEETSSLNIDEIKNMGFSEGKIREAIEKKTSLTGRGYTNAQDLIDDLLAMNASEESPSETTVTNMEIAGQQAVPVKSNKRSRDEISNELQKKSRTSSPSRNQDESEELAKDLKLLQENKMCKQCHRSVADQCLFPCGHISACTSCSAAAKKCPLCRKSIHSKMKVYRA